MTYRTEEISFFIYLVVCFELFGVFLSVFSVLNWFIFSLVSLKEKKILHWEFFPLKLSYKSHLFCHSFHIKKKVLVLDATWIVWLLNTVLSNFVLSFVQ